MKSRTLFTAIFAVCTIFALTSIASAQSVDVRHDSKDAKSVPITEAPAPQVHYLLEIGWISEYNFRGTNLLPGADGGLFYQAQATIPNVGPGSLTLGAWAIHQVGTASSDSWSISEGGGGGGFGFTNGQILNLGAGGAPFINATRFPTTVQRHFREVDLFASYKFPVGPIDITLGNIAFFIHREAQTFETDILPPGFFWVNPAPDPGNDRAATFGPIKTVGSELFDRLYIRLSTTKLNRHITPQLTYYQTVANWGDEPKAAMIKVLTPNDPGNFIVNFPGPTGERNDSHGGYLEGRVNGNFSVGEWLDINPYALVSVSFKDRTEPVAGTYGGRPLEGFNHAQAGLELNIHCGSHVAISPQVAYAYHIAEPPIGTDRNEWWAGVKLSVSLP